jgi:hypothetical protein
MLLGGPSSDRDAAELMLDEARATAGDLGMERLRHDIDQLRDANR